LITIICSICEFETTNPKIINDTTMCPQCYNTLKNYINGNINPNSNIGRQLILKHVVSTILGDCSIISIPDYPYNLFSDSLGLIIIKTAVLSKNKWTYDLTQTLVPDTYILVCYDKERENIVKVFCIESTDYLRSITISNTDIGLRRYFTSELNSKEFDSIYKSVNLNNIPEFRNKVPTDMSTTSGDYVTSPGNGNSLQLTAISNNLISEQI
jgi:hypothetical protein